MLNHTCNAHSHFKEHKTRNTCISALVIVTLATFNILLAFRSNRLLKHASCFTHVINRLYCRVWASGLIVQFIGF
jgi:hypothetical protein